tara:strand:- start:111 stop:389 length:279 start_codon:yes stop_codon:yes gene_type:complete
MHLVLRIAFAVWRKQNEKQREEVESGGGDESIVMRKLLDNVLQEVMNFMQVSTRNRFHKPSKVDSDEGQGEGGSEIGAGAVVKKQGHVACSG